MVLVKDITAMVKDSAVSRFDRYFDGNLIYKIWNPVDGKYYCYDIPMEETKGATFMATEKAVYHVRWIRKAINSNKFRLVMNQ